MKDKLKVHTSSKSNEWETPKDFFKKYNDIYNFEIDVAATDENHLVDNYWTIDDDALTKDWEGKVCWMNPPYGREIAKFIEKAYNESLKGAIVVCLIPSRTDTAWWHDYVMKGKIEFIRGRLKFINRTFPSWRADGNFKVSPAPFPCSVIVFEGGKKN